MGPIGDSTENDCGAFRFLNNFLNLLAAVVNSGLPHTSQLERLNPFSVKIKRFVITCWRVDAANYRYCDPVCRWVVPESLLLAPHPPVDECKASPSTCMAQISKVSVCLNSFRRPSQIA